MVWMPPERFVSDVGAVSVRQRQVVSGGDVSLPHRLEIEWGELVLSVARTRMLTKSVSRTSPERREKIVEALCRGTCGLIDALLDNETDEFCFTRDVEDLVDDERTSFPARVGAAIADLLMDDLGFVWRANARELDFKLPRRTRRAIKRLPDFVYDPGAQNGYPKKSVVVAEAKGSISSKGAKRTAIDNLAKNAYERQVRHFIGAKSPGIKVVSGFAIAFGAVPARRPSTLAVASPENIGATGRKAYSVSAAATGEMKTTQKMEQHRPQRQQQQQQQQRQQQQRPQQLQQPQQQQPQPQPSKLGGGGGGHSGGPRREERRQGQPTGRIAFANYENVFRLCGATRAAEYIRKILSGEEVRELPHGDLIEQFRFYEFGESYLTGTSPIRVPYGARYVSLAIASTSASEILKLVAENPSGPPETVTMSIVPPIPRGADDSAGVVAVQGDGLALIKWTEGDAPERQWNLSEGQWL